MDTILEGTRNNIKIVTFNNPRKRNALNIRMYVKLTEILNNAAADKDIAMVVLTGAGDIYSSGNDLTAVENISVDESIHIMVKCVEAFITFPKLLVAIVNGPAVGVAATTLGLCDFVFASENAFFYTPFTKLGIVAEACSTFTFPRLMGERKAMEMLMLNYKMPAKEAFECGFISNVYKPEDLQQKAWERIEGILSQSQISMLTTKRLLRRVHLDELLRTNKIELQELKRIGLGFYRSKL